MHPPIIFRNEKMTPLFNLTTVYRLGGAAALVALYQEGQGGQRCPFNLLSMQ
jgi:hypothetical protein